MGVGEPAFMNFLENRGCAAQTKGVQKIRGVQQNRGCAAKNEDVQHK